MAKIIRRRTARTLTPIEIEARQQYEDAKAIARIEPAISKLGVWGITKLGEIVKAQHRLIGDDNAEKEKQRLVGEDPREPRELNSQAEGGTLKAGSDDDRN